MGAQFVAFDRVEGSFQQGAEDGWLDLFPKGGRRFDQQFQLIVRDGQSRAVFEQAAVEPFGRPFQHGREAARVHRLPQRFEHGHERIELAPS